MLIEDIEEITVSPAKGTLLAGFLAKLSLHVHIVHCTCKDSLRCMCPLKCQKSTHGGQTMTHNKNIGTK